MHNTLEVYRPELRAGAISCSESSAREESILRVIPNPSLGAVNLIFETPTEAVEAVFDLYDMQGRLIRKIYILPNEVNFVDMSGLSPSVYIIAGNGVFEKIVIH